MNELTYATPGPSGRPGYLTAVGVISIVIGSLSALSNGFTAIGGVTLAFIGPRLTTTMATTVTASASPATAPATGPTTSATTTTVMMPIPVFSFAPQLASAGVALANLLAAVLLLIAGILLLRDRRIARRLHWWFVGCKFPLAIAYAVVQAWVSASMMSGMLASPAMAPAAGGAPPVWLISAIGAVFGAAVSLAYPIALLFVLPQEKHEGVLQWIACVSDDLLKLRFDVVVL